MACVNNTKLSHLLHRTMESKIDVKYTLSKIYNWSPYIFYASFESKIWLNKIQASKAVRLLWIFYVFFCLVFAMPLYASVYMCLVVTCWERVDLLALVCCV